MYDYAFTMVRGKTAADMPHTLHDTFSGILSQARLVPADTVGPGYFAPMRADEFVASRIVEAVVHGIDLTQAPFRPVGRPGLDPGGVRQVGVRGQPAAADRVTAQDCRGSRVS